MVIILFITAFCFSVFCVFCLFCFEFGVIFIDWTSLIFYNIFVIIFYIGTFSLKAIT